MKYCIRLGTRRERGKEGANVIGEEANIVLDGFETRVRVTTNDVVESLTYSTKKKQHSVNVLVAVSPRTKRVRWISYPVGGQMNDYTTANEQLKDIYDNLHNNEIMIGDEGFEGMEHWKLFTIKNKNTT